MNGNCHNITCDQDCCKFMSEVQGKDKFCRKLDEQHLDCCPVTCERCETTTTTEQTTTKKTKTTKKKTTWKTTTKKKPTTKTTTRQMCCQNDKSRCDNTTC